MSNPLFTPRPPAPAPAAGAVTIVSEDEALRVTLPPGWSGTCEIRSEAPNGRYLFIDAHGPAGELIYAGHHDLPQRYVVPGPWMGMITPGARMKFGDGAAAQWLFPAPASTAEQMARHLIARRFGDVAVYRIEQAPTLAAGIREGAAKAGLQPDYIDACDAFFTEPGNVGSWAGCGMMRLAVFGQTYPGGTWQVENISGYRCDRDGAEQVHSAHEEVIASVRLGEKWSRDHPDEVSQAVRDEVNAKRRAADEADRTAALAARAAIDGIRRGAATGIRDRRADINGLL